MPRAPKKCGREGCEVRVTGKRYCPAHVVIGWQTKGASRTSTTEHKAWRKAVLDRDHWWCQIRELGCTRRANNADHIVPVAFGGSAFDLSNGQAACKVCHDKKSKREATEGRRRAGV
jgi:5-methylcytosine-specific restriction enzyme A